MGCCISKSNPAKSSPSPAPTPPSKNQESSLVQDKLVIILSHPPQISFPSSPTLSSASSSFPSTNSTSSSSSASSITSCSSSSSISVSKDKPSSSYESSSSPSYSNDYSWSCKKENPHLSTQATLDKAHGTPQNSILSSTNSRAHKTEPSPTKSTLPSSTKKKNQSLILPTPQKRACSLSTTSPSSNIVSRQKSFRTEHQQHLPNAERCSQQLITATNSSVLPAKRNNNMGNAVGHSSSPVRRSKDTAKGISRIYSPGNKRIWNQDQLDIYRNTNQKNIKETTIRPVIRPSSPQRHNYKRSPNSLESRMQRIIASSTTTTHHIYDHEMDEIIEEEEVLSSSCVTDNHQEKEYYLNSEVVSAWTYDIDNPLISLDCFIFL